MKWYSYLLLKHFINIDKKLFLQRTKNDECLKRKRVYL